jgi:hypothetical protein
MIMTILNFAGDAILFCSAVFVVAALFLSLAEKAGAGASIGYSLLLGAFVYVFLWFTVFACALVAALPVALVYLIYCATNWIFV